jgi:aryl-alcohol dehydrogenase-like predicted oxidoreductase
VGLTQLALAWCLLNPHVSTVMLGASKLAQLESNLGALDVLPQLVPDVVREIERTAGGREP